VADLDVVEFDPKPDGRCAVQGISEEGKAASREGEGNIVRDQGE
jgi:hypothetical protein